jgi:arylsulfatase A-like enzyme
MLTTQDQTSRSPDILISFKWSDEATSQGIQGTAAFVKGNVPVGAGSHGSLSPFEIRNLLLATGPDFKNGICDQTPSGIIDLMPTILHILGLSTYGVLDGRVLSEALAGGPNPNDMPCEAYITRASRTVGGQTFEQELRTSRVNSTEYLDWGKTHRIK